MKQKCECGKEIAEDYLPSFFCEECVNQYMEDIKTKTKASLFPDMH